MDRNKRLPVTPLMFFSLILSLSIITARYSYDYFSTRYWLIAAIIAISLAGCCYVLIEARQFSRLFFRKIKQLVLLQSLLLSLCLFCLGGFITSHHIDKTKAPGSIMTYQSLSPSTAPSWQAVPSASSWNSSCILIISTDRISP